MMKKLLILFTAAVAACGSLFAEQLDHWVYDATAKTISDGVWTFAAKVTGTTIAINGVVATALPTDVSPLDFSMDVVSADDSSVKYVITTLNPQFSGYRNGPDGWTYHANAGAELVGEVTLPVEGLVEIGAGAFGRCENATGTIVFPDGLKKIGGGAFNRCKGFTFVNTFPATVTSLGDRTFHLSSITGDILALGVSSVSTSTFQETSITSIRFGSSLASIGGGYGTGAFQSCTSLTNLFFDPATTGAKMETGWNFYNCKKLTELDLSGFESLVGVAGGNYYPFGECSGVKKVVFGSGLKSLPSVSLRGLSGMREVHFYGAPPADLGLPVFSGLTTSEQIITYIHVEKDDTASLEAWKQFAQNGELNETTSTWSEAAVGSNYAKRSLVIYRERQKGDLGYWVFDPSAGTVTHGDWIFQGSVNGEQLTVGECLQAPATPSELDFSQTASDVDCYPLIITVLNTKFAASPTTTSPKATERCGSVSRLVLPTNGLVTISAGAFGFCTNLTEIVNYIPDCVSDLGMNAFSRVPAQQTIKLMGLTTVNDSICQRAGVTEVRFGPRLTKIQSSYLCAPFESCKSLTNVVFHPQMSGAEVTGAACGPFDECSKLTGTMDLTGFSKLRLGAGMGHGICYDTVIIADGTDVTSDFFRNGENLSYQTTYGFYRLTNVIFKGVPPMTIGSGFFKPYGAKHKIVTTIYSRKKRVENTVGTNWVMLAKNNLVNHKTSTWAPEFVGGEDYAPNRLLLTVEPDGLMLIVK